MPAAGHLDTYARAAHALATHGREHIMIVDRGVIPDLRLLKL